MTATDGPVEPKKVLASGKLKTGREEGENRCGGGGRLRACQDVNYCGVPSNPLWTVPPPNQILPQTQSTAAAGMSHVLPHFSAAAATLSGGWHVAFT